MNTEENSRSTKDNSGDSAVQQVAPENESDDASPEGVPPGSKSSELLKAMYYWVLSRL
jgi:hypothetical protein